jgi:hypothetical protein
MVAGIILTGIGPLTRVLVAVVPFAAALLLRLGMGRSRFTNVIVSVGTMWFLVNVLIAPYSLEMQQELHIMLRR